MGQVYDIPYSALIATLLLKNRVVTFKDICDFEVIVSSFGSDYCTVDDVYVSNLPYTIDDFLSMFLSSGDDYVCIQSDLDYDSVIGNLTVREILEKTAGYPGDILLNHIGYQRNKNKKVLSKSKNRFLDFCNKVVI